MFKRLAVKIDIKLKSTIDNLQNNSVRKEPNSSVAKFKTETAKDYKR